MNTDISYYINPNTRNLTSDIKNTAVKDKEAVSFMFDQLRPVEDLTKILKAPINLAESTSLDKAANSIHLAAGTKIHINDGYVLTVKPQGVEVSGGDRPYNQDAYLKAEQMASSLGTLLRSAGGTMSRLAHSTEGYQWVTQGITDVLGYLGINTGKDFYVNGMKYSKNKNGWYESQADSEAKAAYERLKANNRTFTFADERTKNQIAYISSYYLENATESLKTAWQKTLEETGINPFPQGFSNTLSQLAMEQDFATGGNDDIFGSSLESNIAAVKKIMERLQNPLSAADERNAEFAVNEKTFYTALLNHLA